MIPNLNLTFLHTCYNLSSIPANNTAYYLLKSTKSTILIINNEALQQWFGGKLPVSSSVCKLTVYQISFGVQTVFVSVTSGPACSEVVFSYIINDLSTVSGSQHGTRQKHQQSPKRLATKLPLVGDRCLDVNQCCPGFKDAWLFSVHFLDGSVSTHGHRVLNPMLVCGSGGLFQPGTNPTDSLVHIVFDMID